MCTRERTSRRRSAIVPGVRSLPMPRFDQGHGHDGRRFGAQSARPEDFESTAGCARMFELARTPTTLRAAEHGDCLIILDPVAAGRVGIEEDSGAGPRGDRVDRLRLEERRNDRPAALLHGLEHDLLPSLVLAAITLG